MRQSFFFRNTHNVLTKALRFKSSCGVTKWSSLNCSCQSVVSRRFYLTPTVLIICRLWDWWDQFVEYISTYILLCLYLIFSFSQKSYLSLNLCIVRQLLVWKKSKLVKMHDSNFHVKSLCDVRNISSPNRPLQLIVSRSFYCNPTVTIQCCLWDFRDQFFEHITTHILLCWNVLFWSTQKVTCP